MTANHQTSQNGFEFHPVAKVAMGYAPLDSDGETPAVGDRYALVCQNESNQYLQVSNRSES